MLSIRKMGSYLAKKYELIPQLIIVGSGVVVGVVFTAWNLREFLNRDKEPPAPYIGMKSDIAPPAELASVPPREREGFYYHK